MKQNAVSTQISVDVAQSVANSGQDVSPPPLPEHCNLSADKFTLTSPPPVCGTTGDWGLTTRVESDSAARQGTRTRSPQWNVQSTSWLSSIAVHLAGLLLLLLILVPADFGGTGMDSLSLTLGEEGHQEEIAILETTLADADSMPTLEDSNSPSELSGIQIEAFAEGAIPGRLGSAGGSFFGIEAGGHQFVYVLDMSGSMKGRRFRRATDELVRSVEQLGPHQSFYVLLFSSGTTQMFGRSESLPQPVAATMENKRRLADWLLTAFQGGGTDPREALRIAMGMNPSAIFMLSDGEFNGRKYQKRQKLFGGNADAFSIVAAASNKTPIHSIAFEDRRSRSNMKRLAEMTEGKYRFVPLEDGIDPTVSLQNARSALLQGDSAGAERSLDRAIVNLEGEEGDDARKTKVEIGEALLEFAENGLKKGKLHSVRTALSKIVQMDEKATVTEETQTWLVEQLLESLQDNKNPEDAGETLSFLGEFLQQSPRSAAAQKICGPLAQVHLNKARQIDEKGDFLQAVRNLEIVMQTFLETSVFQECQAEHERIGDELIKRAQRLRQEKGDVASAQHLRQLAEDAADTLLNHKVTQTLEAQAHEMLVAARDAANVRDRLKLAEIRQKLKEGFGEDPLLDRIQKELSLNERRAQAIIRTAVLAERSSRMLAISRYRTLIEKYPGSIAAQKAEERLRVLGW